MLKTWEKMACAVSSEIKDPPEDLNELISEIRINCPELLIKFNLIGDKNVKAESLVAVHRFGLWAYFGMPVFQVTEDLVASLILTDPQNVLAEEVKFPYRSFLVKVPDGFWQFESLMDGSTKKANWVWVHEYRQVDRDYENRTWWRIDAVSDDGTCITYFDKKPNGTMKEFLAQEKKIGSPLYIEVDESEAGVSVSMRRLVVNLCLYLSEVGDMEKKAVYNKSSKARRKKKKKSSTWIVGRKIKISKDLIDAAKSWILSKQGKEAGWTIKKRFAVRGHWRNQPFGKERKLRKKIWIAPHWKGPGKGEKLPRVYDVQS